MNSSVVVNRPAINAWNPGYLEAQYDAYRADPASVAEDLRLFFQGFDLALAQSGSPRESGTEGARGVGGAGVGGLGAVGREGVRFHVGCARLVRAYREHAHLCAKIDPFSRERARPACLSLAYHALSEADLPAPVAPENLPAGMAAAGATLAQVIEHLERVYCGTTGVEFMHVSTDQEREWFTRRLETTSAASPAPAAQRERALRRMLRSEQMERFFQKRYPGDKRFSLEGGEAVIPMTDTIIEALAERGVGEVVIGMPHRGRVNVLVNVLGKAYAQVFTEFEDAWSDELTARGHDVKYHRGYSCDTQVAGRKVHLVVASNPSHLESVGPVVCGRVRAKQDLLGDTEHRRVAAIVMHGDAAVPGQGVVTESINASRLEGYNIGGTIHLVINNLVGFTTDPSDSRSTEYCTDAARMGLSPVIHVNGSDPDACVAAARLAADYRAEFGRDVWLDVVCYRLYGHNEQDEASFTNPVLMDLVKKRPSVVEAYAARLVSEGVVTPAVEAGERADVNAAMEAAQAQVKKSPSKPTVPAGGGRWAGIKREYRHAEVRTGVALSRLAAVCEALGSTPESFAVHPRLKKLLSERAALAESASARISHADAELLALGTLTQDGCRVRLAGQDSRRGTFSQRHAVLRDTRTARMHCGLGRLGPGRFEVIDSPLSEYSALAFEYGYSLTDPKTLVLWEAQFGDFCNGAQIIIDQYLAPAEFKWERWSGLVMLLPHGYEGAGPEHSSCRIERFLQLCGDNNMQVVNPSTAAQYFHLLRRQMAREFRKPLIVPTPKSMLRVATSEVGELVSGRFEELLDDPAFASRAESNGTGGGAAVSADRSKVKRVLLCSGKIAHELLERRDALRRHDTAIVRVEQLYPFHHEMARAILAKYPAQAQRVWVQEEHRNAGAFTYMQDVFLNELDAGKLGYIGRFVAATPATGSKHHHKEQQEAILAEAVGPLTGAAAPASAAPAKPGVAVQAG